MCVMHIGHMRVIMAQLRMAMRMCVRLAGRVPRLVVMPVMLVVNVGVAVRDRLVHMLVLVTFGEMKKACRECDGAAIVMQV